MPNIVINLFWKFEHCHNNCPCPHSEMVEMGLKEFRVKIPAMREIDPEKDFEQTIYNLAAKTVDKSF